MDSFLKQHCTKDWQQFIDFHKSIITFEANSLIFSEGDEVKGLYVVNEGKVKVYSTEADGKENIIRLASDGKIIGHRGFGGNWKYPVSAKSYVKTTMSFIPLDVFNTIAKTNTEFTYQLMMFYAEELRLSEERNTLVPVKNRIAKAILQNFEAFGADTKDPLKLSYTISRKDYASKVNTTYETVIRVLSELNKDKVIELQGKSIKILNLEELNLLSK